VLEECDWFEFEVVALKDVEAGETTESVFEGACRLVLVGDREHFDTPDGAATVFGVFPDDLMYFHERFFRRFVGVFTGLCLFVTFAFDCFGLSLCFGFGFLDRLERELEDEVWRLCFTALGLTVG